MQTDTTLDHTNETEAEYNQEISTSSKILIGNGTIIPLQWWWSYRYLIDSEELQLHHSAKKYIFKNRFRSLWWSSHVLCRLNSSWTHRNSLKNGLIGRCNKRVGSWRDLQPSIVKKNWTHRSGSTERRRYYAMSRTADRNFLNVNKIEPRCHRPWLNKHGYCQTTSPSRCTSRTRYLECQPLEKCSQLLTALETKEIGSCSQPLLKTTLKSCLLLAHEFWLSKRIFHQRVFIF